MWCWPTPARKSFVVVDVTEILIHWHVGRSKFEVAVSLGVHRETVAKYVARAEAEGFVPGGPPLAAEQWATLVRGWFLELVDPRFASRPWPHCPARIAPFHDRIKTGLETNHRAGPAGVGVRDGAGQQPACTERHSPFLHFGGGNWRLRVVFRRRPAHSGHRAVAAKRQRGPETQLRPGPRGSAHARPIQFDPSRLHHRGRVGPQDDVAHHKELGRSCPNRSPSPRPSAPRAARGQRRLPIGFPPSLVREPRPCEAGGASPGAPPP